MGSENLEIVRRGYAAMDARDIDAIEEISSADVEWISDPRTGIGTLRGRDDVLRFFADQAEMFGEVEAELEETREAGDRVLVFLRIRGSGVASGAQFDIRIAHLWTLREGLLVRGQGFGDRDEALAVFLA
jgi:uncharacterized protein